MKKNNFITCVVITLLMIGSGTVFSKNEDKKVLHKSNAVAGLDFKTILINNLFNYYSNVGDGSFNPYVSNSALEFPKGSNHFAIYHDGLLFGGVHAKDGKLKVGGSFFRSGLQPGKIITAGTASTNPVAGSPSDEKGRLYRVRTDINPTTPLDAPMKQKINSEELAYLTRYESGVTVESIYEQYIKDWNEWPATDGAPFKDVDNNGVYNPSIDIPGIPGADQTLWHVSNDLDQTLTQDMYGSDPIGMEVQRTIWGYNRSGALGNAIFIKYKLINKSGYPINDMYVTKASDPDLGGATDDFVGCDTLLSLGFCYNGDGSDTQYGAAIPASGYDFLQGPIIFTGIDTDTAVYNFTKKVGYRNLPMSSFNFFVNGLPAYGDPPQDDIQGTIQWYNLMKGLIGNTGADNINPSTGMATKFSFSGNPVTSTGWNDGVYNGGTLTPGDRRFSLTAGPFNMADGEEQEVVVALMVGQGTNRLESITVLKSNDAIIQEVYNNNFEIASPPAKPVVSTTTLDGELILNWGDGKTASVTENQEQKGYKFQGYKVYQVKSNSFSSKDAVLLATYDIVDGVKTISDNVFDPSVGVNVYKPVHFGTDGGIRHVYRTKEDAFTLKSLINGKSYYYAVTAYSYNPTPIEGFPNNLESAPAVFEAIPQMTNPGTRYSVKYDDVIETAHTGPGDGSIEVKVVQPDKVTGHNYAVRFDTLEGQTIWKLIDVTTGEIKLDKMTNQSGDENYYVVDGLLVKVITSPPGMKKWEIPSGTRRFSPVGGFAGLGLEGFSSAADPTAYDQTAGTIGMAGHFAFGGIGTTLQNATDYHTVLLKLAPVDSVVTDLWNPLVAQPSENFSKGYRYLRNATGSAGVDSAKFAPWVINKAAGYPYQDFNYSVPFSAWDMETTPPTRLAVGFLENHVAGASVNGLYMPPNTNGDNTINREFIFIFNTPYSETPDPSLQVNISNNSNLPLMWVGTFNRRTDLSWVDGDEFKIVANKVNTMADEFTFTAPTAATQSSALAKTDVEKINVFPNPYFGFNSQEKDKYNRFITFSHLPEKATIRIYNLAGVLVKTIVKDDATQFTRWNLKNESNLPVAAGMYIVHVNMKELGKTKVLKVAIIPEAQFLDTF